jgi:hypothetical protein
VRSPLPGAAGYSGAPAATPPTAESILLPPPRTRPPEPPVAYGRARSGRASSEAPKAAQVRAVTRAEPTGMNININPTRPPNPSRQDQTSRSSTAINRPLSRSLQPAACGGEPRTDSSIHHFQTTTPPTLALTLAHRTHQPPVIPAKPRLGSSRDSGTAAAAVVTVPMPVSVPATTGQETLETGARRYLYLYLHLYRRSDDGPSSPTITHPPLKSTTLA